MSEPAHPKVYFSAKIGCEQFRQTNQKIFESCFQGQPYQVFMPQNVFIPELPFSEIERLAFEIDRTAIDWCDFFFLLSPYGKDCSWEVGYAAGKGKPIVVYLTEKSSIQDSMVMGSASLIMTDQKEIWEALQEDARTAKKSVFFYKGSSLSELLARLYSR